MLPPEAEPYTLFLLSNLLIVPEQLERDSLTRKNEVKMWDTYPFRNSIKIWPFLTLSVTHYRLEKERSDVYERDIKQEEEGRLNRGPPEHLAISDVSISMVTHYLFRWIISWGRRRLCKHWLEISLIPLWKTHPICCEEWAMIYLIHA